MDTQEHLPSHPPVNVLLWIRFLHVVLFITFVITTISLSGILHYAISQYFQQASTNISTFRSTFDEGVLRAYLAALIVSFPFFALSFIKIQHFTIHNPLLKKLPERLQISYVILILSFTILFIRLILITYSTISGTLSLLETLHFSADFIIAGAICLYVLNELRAVHPRHNA